MRDEYDDIVSELHAGLHSRYTEIMVAYRRARYTLREREIVRRGEESSSLYVWSGDFFTRFEPGNKKSILKLLKRILRAAGLQTS